MTPGISFLIFTHVSHVRQNLAHVHDHVLRFYGNCRTLMQNEYYTKTLWQNTFKWCTCSSTLKCI